MYFQALEYKRRNFLESNNDNDQPICLTYSKESVWLKYFGLSNLMCTCITRLIINHAPIDKYKLRFFSKEPFTCMYGEYPIKMRKYILFDYVQYKKS